MKPEDPAALERALRNAGIEAIPSGDGGFRAEVEPVDVGRAAAAAGVVLVELKRAEGAGLEEMFLQLTADDAREQPHRRRSPGMSTHQHGTVGPARSTSRTTAPVPFTRLVKVEMRKMIDTRAGLWLLIAIVVITA